MLIRLQFQIAVIILFSFFYSCNNAMAGNPENSKMISEAGSQRMLSQRILRDYALVGMGVTYKNPAQDLAEKIELFDTRLKKLKEKAADGKVYTAFEAVDILWQKIQPQLRSQPDKKNVVELSADIDELLAKINTSVLLLQKELGTQQAEVVNISGRQRMLSQKMAALYMLYLWDIPDTDFFESYRKVVDEFQLAQNFLFKSPETTPAIRAELKKSSGLFRWFLKASQKTSAHMTPEVLQRNSDGLLDIMERITQMYVKK